MTAEDMGQVSRRQGLGWRHRAMCIPAKSWCREAMIALLTLCLVPWVFAPVMVLADAAPPAPPPGSSLGPGESVTAVRMVTETVIVAVRAMTTTEPLVSGYKLRPALADVTARFLMRNLGDAEEQMAVRFPLEDPGGDGDGYGGYPLITDFRVAVDGGAVTTRRATTPNLSRFRTDPDPIDWAAFDVRFPPGSDVLLEVSYVQSGGEVNDACFDYVLQTGAGWKDHIGVADIILRLPYRAETLIAQGRRRRAIGPPVPAPTVDGSDLRWRFEDLEPTAGDDLRLCTLHPFLWQPVAEAQAAVDGHPEDPDAWAALARTFIPLGDLMGKPKGEVTFVSETDLDARARASFDKLLALAPLTARAHADYATYLWSSWFGQSPFGPRPEQDLDLIAGELTEALRLDPLQPEALALLKGDRPLYRYPSAYPFDWSYFSAALRRDLATRGNADPLAPRLTAAIPTGATALPTWPSPVDAKATSEAWDHRWDATPEETLVSGPQPTTLSDAVPSPTPAVSPSRPTSASSNPILALTLAMGCVLALAGIVMWAVRRRR